MSTAEPSALSEKQSILVVDDSADNLMLLTAYLRGQYNLLVAADGAKALELAFGIPTPDLVLLDIMMPAMDGYEVCRRLKKEKRLEEVPVVFVSALDETVDKVRGFSVGGVDYVTKPFQMDEVRARIETHLHLRRLRIELENRNRELQHQYEQLSRLNAQKDEFMRIASHDLKNPLACIHGFSKLVRQVVPPGAVMTEDMHNCLTRIINSTTVMQKIIEDYLDFQAMEDGHIKLELNLLNLNDIARAVGENNQVYSARKSVPLQFSLQENLPALHADAGRIQQVMENFVGNALKFSPAGMPVQVRTLQDNDWLVFEVEDRGPGLTQEDMTKLFVKYAVLSNKPTGGEKSSGLGLAICKKIMEMHAGRIGARNNKAGGCTFYFALPSRRV